VLNVEVHRLVSQVLQEGEVVRPQHRLILQLYLSRHILTA
jgi:hypothetical protein